ncbi:MAG: hypothetical protein K8S15_14675 [Candidatus Aegiribacteria sp.]|nr:hypothetical protein [Candidatus Aegiribacteria sp.]
MVVLASEIGDAIEIESFSWKRSVGGEPQGSYNDLKIYMGLCSSNQLGLNFDDNYITGTKILVLSSSLYTTPSVNPNEWFDIVFDTPFWYNGQDNLLIEIEWSSAAGSDALYSWHWDGGANRCIFGRYGSSAALFPKVEVPNLRLNGTLSLTNSTFARIKALFM